MAYMNPYATALTVFGEQADPRWLVERIGSYDWRESMLRLAELAAMVANDPGGPASQRVCRMLNDGLMKSTASTPAAARVLLRARDHIRRYGDRVVMAHEEAIVYLQHVVLLHGGTAPEAPGDGELALWLLAVADHLDAWAEPDDRVLTPLEQMVAGTAKVYRFNRSPNSLNAATRTYEMFREPPAYGALRGEAWQRLQSLAFGGTFEEYFESFLFPLFVMSHSGAASERGRPRSTRSWGPWENFARWATSFCERDHAFKERLREFSGTREELKLDIRKRMRPDGLLPHSPTALLHRPFVELDQTGLLPSSPWAVRAILGTGVWARYRHATSHTLGENRVDAWMQAFGLMFEQWLRRVARMASASAHARAKVVLPAHTGSSDEIEDVVVVEDTGAILFSAKARMMAESVARHSVSRTRVVDWYEQYFFAQGNNEFRAGAIRQLSSKIDKIRLGVFEPQLPRSLPVFPVLVTFDSLGESVPLYLWLRELSQARGLLTQPSVGHLTLAGIEHFETLLSCVAAGASLVEIFSRREAEWESRRLDVQLAHELASPPMDGLRRIYEAVSRQATERITALLATHEAGR